MCSGSAVAEEVVGPHGRMVWGSAVDLVTVRWRREWPIGFLFARPCPRPCIPYSKISPASTSMMFVRRIIFSMCFQPSAPVSAMGD